MVEIVHNNQEIFLKQFFFQNLLTFWLYDVILTPKIALFEHFVQILQISAFFRL